MKFLSSRRRLTFDPPGSVPEGSLGATDGAVAPDTVELMLLCNQNKKKHLQLCVAKSGSCWFIQCSVYNKIGLVYSSILDPPSYFDSC